MLALAVVECLAVPYTMAQLGFEAPWGILPAFFIAYALAVPAVYWLRGRTAQIQWWLLAVMIAGAIAMLVADIVRQL